MISHSSYHPYVAFDYEKHEKCGDWILKFKNPDFKKTEKQKGKSNGETFTREKWVNRRLPSLPLFIINPSLHLSIGSHAVRLYWGGAECVYKVMTRANSWPLGCPRSQQTINPVNVNWDNQRKRLHLWFAACKHFNRPRCWSPCRQGRRPWPSSRLQDSLVFVTGTKQRERFGKRVVVLFPCFCSPSFIFAQCCWFCRLYKWSFWRWRSSRHLWFPGREGISEDFTQPKSDLHQGLSRWDKHGDRVELAC